MNTEKKVSAAAIKKNKAQKVTASVRVAPSRLLLLQGENQAVVILMVL